MAKAETQANVLKVRKFVRDEGLSVKRACKQAKVNHSTYIYYGRASDSDLEKGIAQGRKKKDSSLAADVTFTQAENTPRTYTNRSANYAVVFVPANDIAKFMKEFHG